MTCRHRFRPAIGSWFSFHRSGLCPLAVLLGLFSIFQTALFGADEPGKLLSGTEFTRALNRPLLVNQDYTSLRKVLNRLADDREVAVYLDRRIDPEQLVLVEINAPYFDTGIEKLARQCAAGVVIVADSVFVTTPETAADLRTRIALAERGLEQLPKPSLQRQLELSRKIPLHWERLAASRELLTSFAEKFQVKIENPEAIPHDLWEEGKISHAHFSAGALLIACQYDLDIEWIDSQTVRLVPQPLHPHIEQDHLLRGRPKKQVEELMSQHFPNRDFRITGDRLKWDARVEEHEVLDLALGNRAARKPAVSVIATSLANRRFTLRMMNRPFLELVGVLEKQGIQFQRNDASLQAAGIDLNQSITLELENATIEKLLTEACAPLGLAFQIEGTRVDLGLAPRPVPPE